MRRAFVMGSNGPAGSTQLRYVLNDVENMRTVLSDPRCSFEVESPDPNLNIWKIYEQLANITASCTQDETFLCYFSGHGRLENIVKDASEEQQAIKTVLDRLVDERLLVAGKDIEGTLGE